MRTYFVLLSALVILAPAAIPQASNWTSPAQGAELLKKAVEARSTQSQDASNPAMAEMLKQLASNGLAQELLFRCNSRVPRNCSHHRSPPGRGRFQKWVRMETAWISASNERSYSACCPILPSHAPFRYSKSPSTAATMRASASHTASDPGVPGIRRWLFRRPPPPAKTSPRRNQS